MAEKVKVPGIGEVKSEYVTGGLALVAGIAGYAYWRRARDRAAEQSQIVVSSNDVVPATDYQNPSPGGSSPVVVDNNEGSPPVPRTNSEWTQRATNYLAQLGYDPIFIAEALGRFLNRQSLTEQQKDAVRAAVGAWGQPPEGGPWPIGVGVPTAPDTTPHDPDALDRPGNLRGTELGATFVTLAWDAVSGAQSYEVTHWGFTGQWPMGKQTVNGTSLRWSGLTPERNHKFTVRAQVGGNQGPAADISLPTSTQNVGSPPYTS